MDKKKTAAKRAEQAKKEDTILNRILIWFGGAVLVELILLWLGNMLHPNTTDMGRLMLSLQLFSVLKTVRWVLLGVTAACAIWCVIAWRKGKYQLPLFLTIFFLCAAGSCFLMTQFESAVTVLVRLVLAVTVLAIIYYLYQQEFFFSALLSGGGILALWLMRATVNRPSPVLYYLVVIAAAAGVLLLALFAWMAQKNGGAWKLGSKEFHPFPKTAGYVPIYLSAGIVAVSVVAALIAGATVAYYLIFALVAWLFALAVYFTVKLM